MTLVTQDTLIEDRLIIHQNKNGYRFSIDPVLLAHFVTLSPGDSIIDFGTGCGIIPMLLAYRHKNIRITGCELQQSLFGLAGKNAAQPLFEKRITIFHQDIKTFTDPSYQGCYDSVVCNPPYTKHRAGRVNPVAEKAIARHEISITAKEIVAAAANVLKDQGALYMIYPVNRKQALLDLFKGHGFSPLLLRDVCTLAGKAPGLFLVKAGRTCDDMPEVMETLTIYNDKSQYTDEVKKYFLPRGY